MNWLDFIIAGAALIGLFIGWRMGLLGAIFNVVGIVTGMWVAGHFSDDISSWFTSQGTGDALATVLSYVAIIVGVFVGAQVARGIAKSMLKMVFLGWVDSLGSIAVGMLFGLALSGAVILATARFSSDLPDQGALGGLVEMTGFRGGIQSAMADSQLVPIFIDLTNSIPADAMGFVPGDFRDALAQVELLIQQQEGA